MQWKSSLNMKITFCFLFIVAFSLTPSLKGSSLWDESASGGRSVSLFSDRTAARIGDLVTIVVNQSTVAAKQQSTKTHKTVTMDENVSAFLNPIIGGERDEDFLTRRNPHNTWNGNRTFDGGGTIGNTETLTSTIQARVTDVLPNKVLRIEATRRVESAQETGYLVLSGFIRTEDLTTANSVLSTQVADLEVKQVGNGALSREQRKGWLTRFWETVSPF
jgi:flagellar L-ring protein FlgH